MAKIILMTAVNRAGTKAEPIRIYLRDGFAVPKKQVVLTVEPAELGKQGQEQVRVGNFSLGLISTHNASYIEERLEGFRLKLGDQVFLQATVFTNVAPTTKALKEAEEF